MKRIYSTTYISALLLFIPATNIFGVFLKTNVNKEFCPCKRIRIFLMELLVELLKVTRTFLVYKEILSKARLFTILYCSFKICSIESVKRR